MSGGHFDHNNSYLGYIADQIEQDIEFNDIEYDYASSVDTPYGFQHSPETIEYLKFMVADLRKLQDLLHKYDYAVSGDSSIDLFLETAKAVYRGNEIAK